MKRGSGRKTGRREESGFALLFVFVMAAAIAITLYMEVPRIAFESQRAREQMAIDRGLQYERAIQLFYRKFQTYPADAGRSGDHAQYPIPAPPLQGSADGQGFPLAARRPGGTAHRFAGSRRWLRAWQQHWQRSWEQYEFRTRLVPDYRRHAAGAIPIIPTIPTTRTLSRRIH